MRQPGAEPDTTDFAPVTSWLDKIDLYFLGLPIQPIHLLGFLSAILTAHRDDIARTVIPKLKAPTAAALAQSILIAESLHGLRLDCEDPAQCPMDRTIPHALNMPGLATITRIYFSDALGAIAAGIHGATVQLTNLARAQDDPYEAARLASLIHAAAEIESAGGTEENDCAEAKQFADEMFAKWALHWAKYPSMENDKFIFRHRNPGQTYAASIGKSATVADLKTSGSRSAKPLQRR